MLTAASQDLLTSWAVAVDVEGLYGPAGSQFYDSATRGDRSEVREVITLVRRYPGEILDLAAGSGRLTLPLLALPRAVTALDSSPAMLGILSSRVGTRLSSGLTFAEQDMIDFTLPNSFGIVVLGATSVTLLDRSDRARLFGRVRAHLETGGRFLLSTTDTDGDGDQMPSAFQGIFHDAAGMPVPYYFSQEIDRRAGRRLVNFLVPSTSNAAARAVVFTSVVNRLSRRELASELQDEGFDVESSIVVKASGADGNGLVLLECSCSRR